MQRHIRAAAALRIDVIHGSAHLDGVPFRQDSETQSQILRELTDLGIDSIHIGPGVARSELLALSEFLWQLKEAPTGEPIDVQLAARQIQHISLGRLVPIDTRWKTVQWPDAPGGNLDPSYELSLALTERTFDDVMSGKGIDLATIRDIVHLLIQKVAASNAALGQILAVKLYENLTYCHSVNVATLSLLIGKQIGFDQAATAALAEAALLHDIGKTRIPLDILKKPSALDKRERRMMEAHTTYGAEILVEVDGLRPLTPTVALEHHRGVDGTGYPDLEAAAAASPQPGRRGGRHLRGDDRGAVLSGTLDAGAGLPRAGAARRDEAQHGARQGVRQRDQLLPARVGRAHRSRRSRRRRAHDRRRAAASGDRAHRQPTASACPTRSIPAAGCCPASTSATSSRRCARPKASTSIRSSPRPDPPLPTSTMPDYRCSVPELSSLNVRR